MKLWWLPITTLLVSGGAFAQSKSSADAGTAIAISNLVFHSALQNYRPYSEQPIQVWRESNDNVGRIGGWRAYAREARQADDGKPAKPTKDDPHGGHHGGKK